MYKEAPPENLAPDPTFFSSWPWLLFSNRSTTVIYQPDHSIIIKNVVTRVSVFFLLILYAFYLCDKPVAQCYL